jgi:beta-lactamase regulating signal transducer with metallopeptidase domain
MFEAIGKAALHSFWHGAIIFGFSFLLTKRIKRDQVKITLQFLSLIFLFGLFITTVFLEAPKYRSIPLQMVIQETQELNREEDISLAFENLQNQGILVESSRFSMPYRTLGYLWILGVVVMSIRLIFMYHSSLHRSNTGNEGIPLHIFKIFDHVSRDLKLERIMLKTHEKVISPCVAGIFRLTILIPGSLFLSEDEELIKAILVHELMHIKFNDQVIAFLSNLLQTLLFFNPFAWWMGKLLENEQECRTDRSSHEYLGNRTGYAEQMVKWAKLQTRQMMPVPAFSKTEQGFTSRIKRIFKMKEQTKLSKGRLAVLLLASVSTIVLGCLGIQQGITALQQQATLDKIEALEKQLNLSSEFQERTLELRVVAEHRKSSDPLYVSISSKSSPKQTTIDGLKLIAIEEGIYTGSYTATTNQFKVIIADPSCELFYSGVIIPEDEITPLDIHLKKTDPIIFTVRDDAGNLLADLLLPSVFLEMKNTRASWRSGIQLRSDSEGQITLHTGSNTLVTGSISELGYTYSDFSFDPIENSTLVLERAEIKKTQIQTVNGSILPNLPFKIYTPRQRWTPLHSGISDENGFIEYSEWTDEMILETDLGMAWLKDSITTLEHKTISVKVRIDDSIDPEKLKYRHSYSWSGISDRALYAQGSGAIEPRLLESDIYEFDLILPLDTDRIQLYYNDISIRDFSVLEGDYIDLSYGNPLILDLQEKRDLTMHFSVPSDFPPASGNIVLARISHK